MDVFSTFDWQAVYNYKEVGLFLVSFEQLPERLFFVFEPS